MREDNILNIADTIEPFILQTAIGKALVHKGILDKEDIIREFPLKFLSAKPENKSDSLINLQTL